MLIAFVPNLQMVAAADIAARLEAGFSSVPEASDFESILLRNPDHVIEYIANQGTRLLGTFVTEACSS